MEDEEKLAEELQKVTAEFERISEEITSLTDIREDLGQRQSELKALLKRSKGSENGSKDNASSSCVEIWSGAFKWDSKANDARLDVFGLSAYRANQREIINAVMSGRDVMVIMAAGGGKSLCYQLPTLLRNGVTLVVSPLLSLIQDQVMGLAALGISASMLASTTEKEEEKRVYKALEKGEEGLRILYVTPEKISKSKRFMSKLEKCHQAGRLSLISIDEAHCCSQWGHDFRPDYKNLSILKTQFPKVPLIALTATATQKVQSDLMEMLRIPKCVKFVSTVNRPNLFYVVREKSSVGKIAIDEIAKLIQECYPNRESGIVYCLSRKECEQVAHELRERGIMADYYHADMVAYAREKVHTSWSKNKMQVIVGTVAFGMGINKPDVRFVIHHSLSKSMETYYQESGRAGRDGLPSQCILFFRPGDVPRQSSMVFYEASGLHNLYDIVRYAMSRKRCRRSSIFRHFSEPPQDCNGMCDNCAFPSDDVQELDVSDFAKIMVSLVKETQEMEQRLTMLQLIDKMKTKRNDEGQVLKREEMEQLVIQLTLDCILKEEFQHTAYTTNAYVIPGPLASQVLQGKKSVTLEVCGREMLKKASRAKEMKHELSGLEIKLDKLRNELSSIHGGIFPHSILSTQQISALNTKKPSSMAELEKIIGKVKSNKYGVRILEEISDYYDFGTSKDEEEEEEPSGERTKKRRRNHKVLVEIESSNEDE